MSKKLIAVAAASALALSALVGLPANASAFAVTPTGQTAGTGATAATALTVNVPTSDVLRHGASAASSTIKFAVTATTATGAVTATATGSVRLVTQEQLDDTDSDSKTGATSLSVAAAGNLADIYAYNTSVENGTVTISNGGNSVVYNVKGIAGKAYKMTVAADSSASKGIAFKVAATVVDMFGNPVTNLEYTDFTPTGFGAFTSPAVTGVSKSKGVYNMTINVAESGAGLLTLAIASGKLADEEKASFGSRADKVTVSVNSADPATQITALTAQVTDLTGKVAALTAQLDASRPVATSVTKKKYNTLARKWNAANPSNKVALKK
jgi:hypothetical protein